MTAVLRTDRLRRAASRCGAAWDAASWSGASWRVALQCATSRRVVAVGAALCAAAAIAPCGWLSAQPVRVPAGSTATTPRDSASAGGRPAWVPRAVSVALGGVAATTPDGAAVETPAFGGALDVAAIGRLRGGFAWRAEGFLQAQDRRDPPEPPFRASSAPNGNTGDGDACLPPACTDGPAEHSRRTGGIALGIEHHARPGRAGPYVLALVGLGSTKSYGTRGATLGFAPSAGIGFLSPLDRDLDGFAFEVRWRRIPTALGPVDTGVLSAALRF